MNWLEDYGKPTFRYTGAGTLNENNSNKKIEVQFEIAQLFDGRIFCELRSDSDLLNDISNDCSLDGFTEYGYRVHASQLVILQKQTSFRPTVYSLRTLALGTITVTTPDQNAACASFPTRFLITNFNFFSKFVQTEGFHWDISGRTVTLRPLPNHKEYTELIQATNSTGVTSVITVEPTRGMLDLHECARLATRLCWLLSLAQGCHIAWISHESSLQDRLVQRSHNQVPLLSPSGRQLIPSESNDFCNYVEHCLQVYEAKEHKWQLSTLIDMFVRAVMSQPFLEPQGLHLAVLVDYMRGIYAKSEGKEWLIDEPTFDSIKTDLKHKVSQVLKEVLPNANSATRERMIRHIGQFRWYPFSDSVKGMAKALNLELPDADVDTFVTNRDHLVHRYSFPDGKDPIAACDEMISLASKFLFGVLEYEGYFYDWSIPVRDNWKNRKVRLKFKVGPDFRAPRK